MQTLAFILYCLLLMALVIGGLIHDAPTCQPNTDANGQPITKPRPTDHKLARRLADHIRVTRKGRG